MEKTEVQQQNESKPSAHRDYCAYHAEQAGYGNELRVHCTDGDVVFADDKLNRRGCVLTYPNDRK